jgi:hypothetical protein
MKKILLFVAIALAFTACNTGGLSPKATVDALFTAMKNGNYDEMKKYITKADISNIEFAEQALAKLNPDAAKQMREKAIAEFKDRATKTTYTLTNEKIDGDKASVTADINENGEKKSQNFDLLKEDGAWKVSFSSSAFSKEDKAKMDEAMKNMNMDSIMGKVKEGLKNVNVDSLMDKAKEGMDKLKGPAGDSIRSKLKQAAEQMKNMPH